MNKITFVISDNSESQRLDIFIASKSGLSRSSVQRLIKTGMVTVNYRNEKAGYNIKKGDSIYLTIPDEPKETLEAENIPLDIVWEDEHIVVINKPAGMVVHPGPGNRRGTLINALVFRCRSLASTGAPLRPGIVHRLDKDTSGLVIVAKDDASYLGLVKMFRERRVEKHYVALLYGNLKQERGEITSAIGRSVHDRKKMSTKTRRGRDAITQYEVTKRFKTATLAKIRILTGRTHQIRVHFSSSGHPVLGDKTYGNKTSVRSGQRTINFARQMLHAYCLKFDHPVTGKPLEFTSPLPEDMKKAIEELT